MSRNSYGNFKVLNPTPFEIVTGFGRLEKNGAEYKFAPFEEKQLFVKDHVEHICRTRQADGLVELDYNKDAQKIYPTYEDYKIARAREGLTHAVAKYSEALMYEQAATAAAKNKDQVVELRTMDVDKFESKITELKDLLVSLRTPVKKQTEVRIKPETPAWMIGKEDETEPETEETKPEAKPEADITSYPRKQIANGRWMIDKGKGYKFASKEETEVLRGL